MTCISVEWNIRATASICEFERLGLGAGRYWSLYDQGVWAKPDSCALGSSFE